MKYLMVLAFLLSSSAFAQVCPGPGGCVEPVNPEPPEVCPGPGGCVGTVDPGPAELCFPQEGCRPVQYFWHHGFVLAESALPNGYDVLGFAGPCFLEVCNNIQIQAFQDLQVNALKAHRAQRYDPDAKMGGFGRYADPYPYFWSD